MDYREKIQSIVSSIVNTPTTSRMYADGWISSGSVDREKFNAVQGSIPSLREGIIRQAQRFGKDFEHITVMYSGGIDSETVLLGFILAKVPVKVVFFNFTYHGENNHLDYFHATEFCKKHGVALTIIPFEITDELIAEFRESEWYAKPNLFHGLGSPIQNVAFRMYQEEHPSESLIVGFPGLGKILFWRTGTTCSLTFPENTGRYPGCYKFYSFYPDFFHFVYQYHKHNPLMQIYPCFGDFKIHLLSATGLFPRAKSNSIDFITNQFDRVPLGNTTVRSENRSRLWSMLNRFIDHAQRAKRILDKRLVTVYTFESDVDFSKKIYADTAS